MQITIEARRLASDYVKATDISSAGELTRCRRHVNNALREALGRMLSANEYRIVVNAVAAAYTEEAHRRFFANKFTRP